MFGFKPARINPVVDISEEMAATNGTVGRFAGRFNKYQGTSETFNRSVDATGNAFEDLRGYSGMINEQKLGIDKMFILSERAVLAITQLEKDSGIKQVENIPRPSDIVRGSYGKKMGYTTLALEFLQEGLLHFMEQTLNLQEALDSRDRALSALVAQIPKTEVLGRFEEVSLDDLTGQAPTDVSNYVKSDKPTTPVTSKGKAGKK